MNWAPQNCLFAARRHLHGPALVVAFCIALARISSGQQVATPTFTPSGGSFPIEQNVTVNCATSGATINYTRNGITPTPSDRTVASGGTVLIDFPLTLKANAYKSGMTSSATATANFTITGKLAGGGSHSVGLKSEGTVWAWGSNSSGQLGIGSSDSSTHTTPVQVKLNSTTNLTGMSLVGAGASHSIAVQKSDGSVFGWGLNSSGQLGDNSTTNRSYPVQAKTTDPGNPVLTGIIDIAGGAAHTVALKTGGTVWTWGSNSSGQLGDGSTHSRQLAAQVKTGSSTFLTGVAAVAAGDNFCVAVKTDGTVWAWGDNSQGQIGIGSTQTQKYAVQVTLSGGGTFNNVVDVACGSTHVLALKGDGFVWSWGNNTNGQLGNGTTTQAKNPVQVKINSSTNFANAAAVAAGTSHSIIRKTDGTVYACGLNTSGQLSINSNTQQLYPTQSVSSAGPVLANIVDFACGANHTLVTKNDGTVSGCGLNSSGQAGYSPATTNPTACTQIPNFLIISALDDPDGDGLPTWRERELGTNPYLPNGYDTDGDGMPDGWEVNNGLNPLVNDANADPDGDGFSNYYEYLHGTNPNDYYNAATFNLNILSGNGQNSPPNTWLPQPLVVQVTNTSGGAYVNAPVTFSLGQAAGGLSQTSGGTTFSSLTVRTDANGNATVYYKQPSTANTVTTVIAQTGTVTIKQVTFTASTGDLPPLGLRFWVKADAGITKDGNNNISAWADQSGNNFQATQTNSSYQPSWASAGAGSMPAVYFDGNHRFFNVSDVNSTATAGELFVVLRTAGDQNAPHGFLRFSSGGTSSGPGTDILYPYQGQIYDCFGSTAVKQLGTPVVPLMNYHIYDATSQTNQWSASLNGSVQYSTTTNTVGFTNTPTIGGLFYWFQGYMAEIVVYDHSLSAADRTTVQNYLISKYNGVLVPSAPTNLTGSATTPTQVGLNWQSQGGVTIKVERKTGVGGSYSQIATVTNGSNIYNDSGLSPSTQYYYRVRANNFAGDSAYSNEISITTPASGATLPLTGLKMWLRGDFGVTADGSNRVSNWLDESGNGNSATQSSTGNQPITVGNAMYGKPVLHFDGANSVLNVPYFLQTATAAEAFVILRATSAQPGGNRGLWSFGSNFRNAYPQTDGQIVDDFGSGNRYSSGTPIAAITDQHLYNVVSSSTEWTSRINGSLQFTTSSNTVGFWPWPVIGSGGAVSGYGSTNFDGDIAEVLIYDHALSQTDRDAVTAYCEKKYGLLDSDGDGIIDWKEAQLGTDPNNPDTDGDGMPDGWEVSHGLNPLVNDASGDLDGDGITNLQEYLNGTDPSDYYNGASFNLSVISGDGQRTSPGTWLPQPLVVRITNTQGAPLLNAPVTFSVGQSVGGLSATNGGTTSSSVLCRTDASGYALVYYQTPPTERLALITAQSGKATVRQATFTVSTISSSFPFIGLTAWLRADVGVIKDQNNAVSRWTDETGFGNDAVQNSTGNQPLYADNVINAKPVVQFDGSATSLSFSDFESSFTQGEVFVVLRSRKTQSGTNTLWMMGDDSIWNPNMYPNDDGTIYETFGTRNQKLTGKPSQDLNQFHLYNVSSKSGEFVNRINGREHFRTTSNTVFFPSAPLLGVGVYPGHRFKGDIAEVLIFNRVLSQDDRNAVNLYLNQKYLFIASAPSVPSQFHASALNYSQVSLSWVNPVSNAATFYDVQRRTVAGSFTTIATVVNGMSYIDSSASPATQYVYRIVARNDAGAAAPSAEVNVATGSSGILLPVSDVKLWLKADEGVAKGNANVWTDSSGYQSDGLQVSPSYQPQVVENAMNGKPVVHFDGVGTFLSFPDFASSLSQGEVFVVLKSTGTQVDVNTLWMMGDDSIWNPSMYPASDGTIYETFGTRNQKFTGLPAQTLSEVHFYNVSSKNGEFVTRINGQEQYRTASNSVFFPTAPMLGGGVYGRHRFGGDVAEVIIFNRVLSAQERDRVQYYLADKYLIPGYDLDGDGLTNAQELALGTDPRNPDTNGDGISDGASVRLGIDPLGPPHIWPPSPQPPSNIPLDFTLSDPPGATLIQ